jgi:hypothetical protein
MISINESSETSLSVYYKNSYRPCRLVGRSPQTLEAYDTALSLWNQWPNTVPLHLIDGREVARFSEWLLPGRSSATVNCYVRHIMAILRHAAEEDATRKLCHSAPSVTERYLDARIVKADRCCELVAAPSVRRVTEEKPAA